MSKMSRAKRTKIKKKEREVLERFKKNCEDQKKTMIAASDQMSRKNRAKILTKKGRVVTERLKKKNYKNQKKTMITAKNIHYEMSENTSAMTYGGIGAIHTMVNKVGLIDDLNKNLYLLKAHLPYHESDHILNIAYNALLGGQRLEDIELRRNDISYLNALGADIIPDPTTAGDFTRRFEAKDIEMMMDCINHSREKVWVSGVPSRFEIALIDIDGTIAGTLGECKKGMDMSYKGIWGYHPLLISLANTKEVLYLINRPGNVVSHQGAAEWIDKAIQLLQPHSQKICLRGDTDFSLTVHFDEWSDKVDFVFGMDACKGFVQRAEALEETSWSRLEREPKYKVKTEERSRPKNVKEEIVKAREYKNIRLKSEDIAEFPYSPGKCDKEYRMIVLRKNLSVEKGELVLFDEIRYFFYITTRTDLSASEVVQLANGRCDQENVIEQLKNGVNAMRMPVRDLNSNWAYMVMTSLAWNLKSWVGQLMPNRMAGRAIIKMEFKRFLNTMILIPCQIVRSGRKIIYRILSYNRWLKDLFATQEFIKQMGFT